MSPVHSFRIEQIRYALEISDFSIRISVCHLYVHIVTKGDVKLHSINQPTLHLPHFQSNGLAPGARDRLPHRQGYLFFISARHLLLGYN